MISFESDYNNGMLPEILQRLQATNNERTSGYGADVYTASAVEKIRAAVGLNDADVFFLVGGTQTNATVIDALLLGCEGALTADTGHIAVHESGAVEAFGHKVITLPAVDSKLSAQDVEAYMQQFHADETYPHMVQPRLVYVSMPTELGMLYSRKELESLYEACQRQGLLLYVDGARLGYGLMSDECEYDLPFLAAHCDVFYIGGTKVGALMGEAVVFSGCEAPRHFFTTVKRHGALLAKGRMLGIQFDTLFTDDLYFRSARHAIEMANRLKEIFAANGIPLAVDSPTNQPFVMLTDRQCEQLRRRVAFEVWNRADEHTLMCRFVTSWATTVADLKELEDCLAQLER